MVSGNMSRPLYSMSRIVGRGGRAHGVSTADKKIAANYAQLLIIGNSVRIAQVRIAIPAGEWDSTLVAASDPSVITVLVASLAVKEMTRTSKKELFFSVDIEADGPIPAEYSMLSFGAAAFTAEKEGLPSRRQPKLIATYEANLDLLPDAKQDPDTMAWWAQGRNQAAWKACRKNTRDPAVVMPEFVAWVNETCGKSFTPVFVAYPAGFDFMFMYWYMIKFAKQSPFSFSALDMKSFAMGVLNTPYRETTKKRFPKAWSPPDNKHQHVAIADAIEQGHLFMSMLDACDGIHETVAEAEEEARLAFGSR